jgi:hypothetical protein
LARLRFSVSENGDGSPSRAICGAISLRKTDLGLPLDLEG